MRAPVALRLRLPVPPEAAEAALERVLAAGYATAWCEERFPPGCVAGEAPAAAAALCVEVAAAAAAPLRSLLQALAAEAGWDAVVAEEPAPVEDWDAAWRRFWKPFRCAGFVVAPEWLAVEELPLRPGDRLLRLAKGSAFGTGLHPSTRLALRLLEPADAATAATVLDVGTGSGILAVAAVCLGASRAAGMDPDRHSAPQAQATARANGRPERCRFWIGTLASARGAWPLVLANLEGSWHRRHAAEVSACVTVGGRLLASGIRAAEAPLAEAEYRAQGLELERSLVLGRWRAYLWRKTGKIPAKPPSEVRNHE